MKKTVFEVNRYDAGENKVFDWKDLSVHTHEEEQDGKIVVIQDHLYVKTLFIGSHDSIDNYIEVPEPNQE